MCPTKLLLLMMTPKSYPDGAKHSKINLYICRSSSNPWQDTPTAHISPYNRYPTTIFHVSFNPYCLVISLAPPDLNPKTKILQNKLTFSSSGSWSPKSDAMLDLLLWTSAKGFLFLSLSHLKRLEYIHSI